MTEMDYETVLQEVKQWPLSLQIKLMHEILDSLALELSSLPQYAEGLSEITKNE